MGFAAVHSRAVWGLQSPRVTVEVHLANGLPSFGLVGLAETEVREARERVRSAILNSGLAFPSNQRITVNLAPADLPKESGRFDLPIAVGILAASGALPPEALVGYEFAGELSLSGELRPVRGALAMAQALHQEGSTAVLVLPAGSAQEAALVPGTRVYSVKQLQDVLQALSPATQADAAWQPLQVQTQLFASRKSSFDANQAGLRANLAGLVAQRDGGLRMLTQRQRQLALLQEELGNIQDMVKEGYAPRNRALELQRNLADVSSTIADLESNDQKIQRSMDEMRQRLEQGRAGFQAEVSAQLAEVRREVQADAEKLQAVSQDMEHMDIRSPAAGQVVGLAVQTVGAVIAPGQRVMDIVPAGAPLIVEARIPPHIVDRVKVGLRADVRFSAFAHSPQLTVPGTVQSLSQDVLTDPETRQSYFLARIAVTPEGLAVLGPRTMQAGMTAEVVILTGERTVLQYVLHPLLRRLAQSMKEE